VGVPPSHLHRTERNMISDQVRTRGLIIALVGAIALAGLITATVALANHPLSEAKAQQAFERFAERNGVERWTRGPNCTRIDTYSFHCEGDAVFRNGQEECVEGRVVANGPNHHKVRVVDARLCDQSA
jgi:hypothetical protein